jgi:hypothetical protein
MFDPFGGGDGAGASPSASPSLAPRQHQVKQLQQQADEDDDTHARQPTRASSALTFGSIPIVPAAAVRRRRRECGAHSINRNEVNRK